MTGIVLILGANGRFGAAAARAFANAGWEVRAATRKGDASSDLRMTSVACDVMDRAAVIRTARGADVIVHAVNPPYHQWAKLMPVQTANVIAAGLSSGATVMVPGNVYTFGENARPILGETDALAPTTRKGRLRVELERAFEDAAKQGLRTIILRGGDFIEAAKTGNWFDSFITNKVQQGKFTYPGRMDVVHAWAYLPDMARAMALLADKRDTLAPFTKIGFEGYSLTGAELQSAVAEAVGKPLKKGSVPWPVLRVIGLFNPLIREVIEMRYLWNTPHRIDGQPLRDLLPEFAPTPLPDAMDEIFAGQHKTAKFEGAVHP
ncbi:NAD-dependent epimerase/dehydratase family protein [Sulfitobacter sp. S223]|uniref:NAD-dependent epimerase/dehydratase family protein n=1 Tax=Sulfitobacter sp. S223 TaxID=2867023 RepID=UPI0021A57011|nr:NAD-dependent epimerase/dehydratase family protein [Sulfitobacter sp. S223]UWR25515.1 NAD-dependent epimerase/dehydratase family protein [Sulfitobacter sp. S223]